MDSLPFWTCPCKATATMVNKKTPSEDKMKCQLMKIETV